MADHSAGGTGVRISQQHRRYIYNVAVALILLLGGYGLIEKEQIALFVSLAAALTAAGTASHYSSQKFETKPVED